MATRYSQCPRCGGNWKEVFDTDIYDYGKLGHYICEKECGMATGPTNTNLYLNFNDYVIEWFDDRCGLLCHRNLRGQFVPLLPFDITEERFNKLLLLL